MSALVKLQHDLVVVPIVKAANGVSFICKRFQATSLLKEFGVIGTLSKTYKLINDYNKNILTNSTVNEIKRQRSIDHIGYQKCRITNW